MSAKTAESVKVRQIDGSRIHVMDGLFENDLVRMVNEIFKHKSFAYDDYANSIDEGIMYLNHNCDISSIDSHPVLGWWKKKIIDTVDTLYADCGYLLSRIHCNNQSYGDFQIPHQDIANGLTALYIVNKEWMEEWHGETVFYDRDREPLHIVAPKPGRLMIFPGGILHRGGSPSRKCFEQRLSVAFKFKLGTRAPD